MATGLLNANASSVTLECNGVTAMIAKDTGVLAAGTAGVSGNDVVTIGQLGLSKYYESPEQVITSGGLLTLPHGLGVPLKLVRAVLICKTAELGYTVGEEMEATLQTSSGTAPNSYNYRVSSNASTIYARCAVNGIASINTAGTDVSLTNANWRLIVRAWA